MISSSSHPAASVVILAWIAIEPILFRLLGPRLGMLAGALGGYVLLPEGGDLAPIFGVLAINKRTAIGLGLLLGLLLFDRRSLLGLRPGAVDLPIAAFVLLPILSLAANRDGSQLGTLGQVWANLTEWGLPYLAGRLLAADRDGPRRIVVAIVLAGLATVPIAVYEIVVGPKHYALGLLYGIEPHWNMVERLGGWRPEGFAGNGIELAVWLALATVIAAWAWITNGAWRIARFPAWLAFVSLASATIACRSVYGYLALAIGLPTLLATRLLGTTRWLIFSLALVPPAYMAVRVAGNWDAHELTELAGKAGNASTVGYRVNAETQYIEKVRGHGLAFGFGPLESSIYNWGANAHLWPDGHWIHLLRGGGAVGLAAYYAAFLLVPVALAVSFRPDRPQRPTPWPKTWGLALFVVLHAIDDLHNMAHLVASPLIAGSIAGFFLAGPAVWEARPQARWLPRWKWRDVRRSLSKRVPLCLTIALLAAIEVLGRLPREVYEDPTIPEVEIEQAGPPRPPEAPPAPFGLPKAPTAAAKTAPE